MHRIVVIAMVLALAGARPIAASSQPAAASPASLSAFDVIALEIAYTTVMARYYEPVDPAALLAGARTGIVGYLRGRGVPRPAIPAAIAHADRFAAENAIARDVALAIARYPTRVRTGALVNAAIAGELGALHDPYSVLFEPVAYKKFVGFLDGTPLGGIGAELDVDPKSHLVRIVDVFDGSPAAAAGLAAGDVIALIDGRVPGTTTAAVAGALRGPAGSVVELWIERAGMTAPMIVHIVRRTIVAPDVTGRLLPGGVGYVRLRSFGANSAHQLDLVLHSLAGRGATTYVLDLRANGGGYRDDAVAVASHFVRGTVVTIAERSGAPQTFAATATTPLLGAPLAVLVDGDTASAAEIVAGAIQDAKTGTLVGTTTFGKGLVQETFPLPDGGAIKLTTARYRTPAGRDIEGVGIKPDVVVAEPADARPGVPGCDPQLDRALALLSAPYGGTPTASPAIDGGSARSSSSSDGGTSGSASADDKLAASASGCSSSSVR
jgi:carboxyl-terminal processing protease